MRKRQIVPGAVKAPGTNYQRGTETDAIAVTDEFN